jgi:hypothetical protein
MNLSNDDQAMSLLSKIAPELVEIKQLMEQLKIEPDLVSETIKGLALSGKDNGIGYLEHPILNAGAKPLDVLRGMYLLANIKRFSKWGKVTFLMQDGRVVRVQQEQGYKSDDLI